MPSPTFRIRTGRDFGLVVRERREELGITQAELAEQSGIDSPSGLSRIENGKSVKHLEQVLTALQRLGARVEVTFPDEPSDG